MWSKVGIIMLKVLQSYQYAVEENVCNVHDEGGGGRFCIKFVFK